MILNQSDVIVKAIASEELSTFGKLSEFPSLTVLATLTIKLL